jgi:hypothetical protein
MKSIKTRLSTSTSLLLSLLVRARARYVTLERPFRLFPPARLPLGRNAARTGPSGQAARSAPSPSSQVPTTRSVSKKKKSQLDDPRATGASHVTAGARAWRGVARRWEMQRCGCPPACPVSGPRPFCPLWRCRRHRLERFQSATQWVKRALIPRSMLCYSYSPTTYSYAGKKKRRGRGGQEISVASFSYRRHPKSQVEVGPDRRTPDGRSMWRSWKGVKLPLPCSYVLTLI